MSFTCFVKYYSDNILRLVIQRNDEKYDLMRLIGNFNNFRKALILRSVDRK